VLHFGVESKSLYPWRHPATVWRSIFGDETDILVEKGILVTVRLDAVAHPDFPHAGNILSVHVLPNGDYQGVSEVEEIPSRSLSATDIQGLELRPEAFRMYLREKLEISQGGVEWRNEELLELGVTEVGGQGFYVSYALRQPTRQVGQGLRTRADGAHVIVLFPPAHPEEPDLAMVRLETASPSRVDVIRRAIMNYGLEEKIPAVFWAPNCARLVVDSTHKKVWVDRIELTRLKPDSHAFRFIELIGRSRGAPIKAEAITEVLSPARSGSDGNTVTRQAKRAARKIIEEALREAGYALSEDPFPTAGTGSYRCTLPSFVTSAYPVTGNA
jgi:hypothetical protein